MQWRFLTAELRGFEEGCPDVAGTAVAMAPVADYRDQLFASEAAALEPMAERRQRGFSSGRHCAHLAQQTLGLTPEPIGRADRIPIWPSSSVGSITHTNAVAAAVASTRLTSVGIDLEVAGRVEEKLYRMLFTASETSRLSNYEFDAATVAFSAKEAGYKAIYPLGQKFIGFKEAEIELGDQHTFSITYLGSHAPNQALEQGWGYWRIHDDHVLTVFVIP